MPWDRNRPADAKYQTREHKAERKRRLAELERDGSVQCAQPVCIMPTRTIWHGEPTHLGHDDTGTRYIGLVHPACNVSDAAVRANRRRKGYADATAWVL